MPAGVTALSMEIEIFRNFVTLFMRTLLGLFLFIFCLLGCTRSKEEEAHLKLFDETTPTKEAFQVRFVFSEDLARQAFALAAAKLPVKTTIVMRTVM